VKRIYMLVDPRTNTVRYVGQTSRTLEARLEDHLKGYKASQKDKWIVELVAAGMRPRIELIEDATEVEANEREVMWIEAFDVASSNGDGDSVPKVWDSPLRRMREKKGLSQAMLAKMLGVKQPFIVQLEKGRRRLPNYLIRPMAEALAVPEGELIREAAVIPLRWTRELLSGIDIDALFHTSDGRNYLVRLVRQAVDVRDERAYELAGDIIAAVNEMSR